MAPADTNLVQGFVDAVAAGPDRVAVVVGQERHSYVELSRRAGAIVDALDQVEAAGPLIGLLASRSITAYAGVLGILGRGQGYVPLNPKFPARRNARMLSLAEADVVVVDDRCLDDLADLLPLIAAPTTFLLPAGADVAEWSRKVPGHRFVETRGEPRRLAARAIPPAGLAYVLFTSGSTGLPKGVVVTHANVLAYLTHVVDTIEFRAEDRFSQNFDLTFDLSVHDIFVPLWSGASIYCPTVAETKLPAKYIKKHEITQWFAVPSVTTLMVQLRMARENAYPSIRRSFFCGEALPLSTVRAWRTAAPNSEIINVYGPTEATIAITRYDVPDDLDEADCHAGVVPIGRVFPGQATRVVDEGGHEVTPGTRGELCLSGSQLTLGYWRDEEKTQQQFVTLPDDDRRRWYRTGDIVFVDDKGLLQYVGRVDNQVKIMGYRVELHEIESHLRKVSGVEAVAAIPWPVEGGAAQGVEAFIVADESAFSGDELIEALREHMPEYMVPKNVHAIAAMPLNANGKLDRNKLAATYLD